MQKIQKTCKFIVQGQTCPFGNKCFYTHQILPGGVNTKPANVAICKNILQGKSCPFGQKCHFAHPIVDSGAQQPRYQEEQKTISQPIRVNKFQQEMQEFKGGEVNGKFGGGQPPARGRDREQNLVQDHKDLRNLFEQQDFKKNQHIANTIDIGKVNGILQSFIGSIEKGQEPKFYEKILKDGCILSKDQLQIRRTILKFTSLLISNKSDLERQVIQVAFNNNFYDLESLKCYRIQILTERTSMQSPEEVSQIILDLTQWTQACQRVLFFSKSKYLQIPATELKSFAEQFQKDIEAATRYSFSAVERKIGGRYGELMKELDNLLQHQINLKDEDPNQTKIKTKNKISGKKNDDEPKPTDDFRDLNINPTIDELNNYNAQPFLRKIHLDKGFVDLEDYLDRNFRLLKEDFTCDLREGLRSYKNNPDQRNLLVNIFPNSRVNGFYSSKEYFGLRIQIFQEQRGYQQSWQQQRRLMPGNMIIFSDDSFDKNITICVIRNRDAKQMDYTQKNFGYIEIDVEIMNDKLDPFLTFRQNSNKRIVILESKCYFEAYFHILRQLQLITDFPFEEELVYTNSEVICEPEYLQRMNTNHLIESTIQEFDLDCYQDKAFRNAFTKNISLIQGPPGTGKTFIGEKIAQLMLKMLQKDINKESGLSTGPIFLTCFTNHALDQFLEKISKFTKRIVRIGGGTKNEQLRQFTLSQLRFSRGAKGGEFGKKTRQQQVLVDTCQRLTSFYEQAKFAQIIELNSILFFKNQLGLKIGFDQFAKLYFMVENIQLAYKEKVRCFLSEQSNEFKQYFNLHVTKQIPCASMFDWLGILDLNYVYEKFNQSMQAYQPNQEHNEQIDENQYLNDREEIDNYNYIDENMLEASQSKALLSQLMQKQPLFRQNQFQTYQQVIENLKNQYRTDDLQEEILKQKIIMILQEDPHFMNLKKKWILNNLIIQITDEVLVQKIQDISNEIKENIPILKTMQEKIDQDILQSSDVVAMTTTGVAKYKETLNRVTSKIMIVEEAAQILESHMATSLTSECEHLILIGDHEQLRPNNNVYELSKKYNLDISMFERLVKNNFENVMLKNQRRMRPQISEIMRQIYPNLEDDPIVKTYPDIRGINNKNYIFFNHEFPEEEMQNLQTKINPKEADIIVKFTSYLIQQNYKPEQITILSLYTGQLLRIKKSVIKSFPNHESTIRKVQIVTVDNYQGEENDIVILSLVRSNQSDQIGFLKASNRVCVALSRARHGMFIFGNAQCLRNAVVRIDRKEQKNQETERQEHLWLRVLEILNKRGDIMGHLELKCNNHGNVTIIKNANDFEKVPEGGCKEICNVRMQCGHSCESYCHLYQISETDTTGHDHIRCNKSCERKNKCGHKCQCSCYQCKDELQPCNVNIQKKLECGHLNHYQCMDISEDNECKKQCELIFQCGHQCKKMCKIDCKKMYEGDIKKGYETPCKEKILRKLPCGHELEIDCGLPVDQYLLKNNCDYQVLKTLPCGHEEIIPCWRDPKEYFKDIGCKIPCKGILECDHSCPKKCSDCFKKQFHGQCLQNCGRLNICNHECKDKCSEKCPPCQKQCPQQCSHSRCTQKCGEVCFNCIEPCKIKCQHTKCTKLCYEICDRKPCQKLCEQILSCGHACIGFCGEICPKMCRKKYCKNFDESTFSIFFGTEDDPDARFVMLEDCGHTIESEALRQCFENGLSSDGSIKYLECPKCKSLIRNCQRYQNYIKEIQQRVDKIKQKILTDLSNLQNESINKDEISQLQISIENFVNAYQKTFIPKVKEFFTILLQLCKTPQSKFELKKLSAMEIQTLSCKLNYIQQFMSQIEHYLSRESQPSMLWKFVEFLSPFFKQLQNDRIHEKRLKVMEQMLKVFGFCLHIDAANTASKSASLQNKTSPQELLRVFANAVKKRYFLDEKEFKHMEVIMSKHKEFIKYDGKAFQEMIIKALDLGSGHWYTCPNGHPYAIADCGQAMVESQCPECHCKIGGKSHRLEGDNQQISFGQSAQVKNFHAGDEEMARRLQDEI